MIFLGQSGWFWLLSCDGTIWTIPHWQHNFTNFLLNYFYSTLYFCFSNIKAVEIGSSVNIHSSKKYHIKAGMIVVPSYLKEKQKPGPSYCTILLLILPLILKTLASIQENERRTAGGSNVPQAAKSAKLPKKKNKKNKSHEEESR